jgi:hypothetical protein
MGVSRCVECGKAVNTDWKVCPECGADPVAGFTPEQRVAAEAAAQPPDPVAWAREARAARQSFFEVALPLTPAENAAVRSGRRDETASAAGAARAAQLAAIEAEGWRLIGCGYVTRKMDFEQKPVLDPYEHGWIEGEYAGLYLFRAVAAMDPEAPEAG